MILTWNISIALNTRGNNTDDKLRSDFARDLNRSAERVHSNILQKPDIALLKRAAHTLSKPYRAFVNIFLTTKA